MLTRGSMNPDSRKDIALKLWQYLTAPLKRDFTHSLFRTITVGNTIERNQLRRAFPEHVAVVELYEEHGTQLMTKLGIDTSIRPPTLGIDLPDNDIQ